MIVYPNGKINLGLHILQKRADGFHDLQTVFYPVALQDGLEIIQNISGNEVELTTSGLAMDMQPDDNICFKAYQLLKKDFPQLPAVNMHLHKVIPSGAGLGGGSADGTFALLLLNKKFGLGISKEQLLTYALQLGSDCPFFIINEPCFATGRGEKLEKIHLNLSAYQVVLVNPKIHINTGWAFSRIIPNSQREPLKNIMTLPVREWKEQLTNDFEEPVFAQYPEVRNIKNQLYQRGALYAAMSGSGSSVYGLFEKDRVPQLDFPFHYFMKSI